jgi:hypothetical protein
MGDGRKDSPQFDTLPLKSYRSFANSAQASQKAAFPSAQGFEAFV